MAARPRHLAKSQYRWQRAVHCGGPVDDGFYALLYVSSDASDHTVIRISSDSRRILEHAQQASAYWSDAAPDAPSTTTTTALATLVQRPVQPVSTTTLAPTWQLAIVIGQFGDRASANLFCVAWATKCRGASSRAARGEILAHKYGLRIYGDFRVILRTPRAYDEYVQVVER